MVYIYECDGQLADTCDGDPQHEKRPMLTGEFNEHLYDNTAIGDQLNQLGYTAGDLVTLCPDCVLELLHD